MFRVHAWLCTGNTIVTYHLKDRHSIREEEEEEVKATDFRVSLEVWKGWRRPDSGRGHVQQSQERVSSGVAEGTAELKRFGTPSHRTSTSKS